MTTPGWYRSTRRGFTCCSAVLLSRCVASTTVTFSLSEAMRDDAAFTLFWKMERVEVYLCSAAFALAVVVSRRSALAARYSAGGDLRGVVCGLAGREIVIG